MKRFFKYLLYPFEALLFLPFALIGYLLPYTWSSNVGALMVSFLGTKLTRVNAIAKQNFKLAGFSFTPQEEKEIIKEMWKNLGRTFIEYFRLPYQDPFKENALYEIEGLEHIDAMIQDGKPGLLFTAHYGNWELGTYVAQKRGLKLAQITRFLNNPIMRFWINKIHGRVAHKIIPKGTSGAKEILKELKKGNHVSMLADQKLDEGLPIPFFGRDAMTAPAFARMALKFDCPFVPFQVIRLKGARCKIIYYPPLKIPTTGSTQEKTITLLKQMNQHIENWIKEHPEQWFWVHRRWDKAFYTEGSLNDTK